ncbi:MAG: ABC transporter permease, partial [Gemmatimonadales bacterium]
MIDLYSERFRDAIAGGGLVAGLALFVRSTVNVLVTGIAERLAQYHRVGTAGRVAGTAGAIGTFAQLESVTANVGNDLKNAARSIRRSLRLSLAAMACIALGTAASSAVLTLYSSAVLRPLPFPDAERLVRVWLDDPQLGPRRQLNLPDVLDLETQVTTLDRFVATARSRVMFLGERSARRVEGEAVTAGYFDLLGVEPFLGRLFLPDEHLPGSEPVMALSYGTWNSHYGGDPDILGSTVRASDRNYTVVGILPPDFLGTIEDDFPDIEFWIPMVHDRTDEVRRSRTGSGYIWTIGRLGPGIGMAQAEDEVRTIGTRIAQANPETRGPMQMRVEH